MTNKMIKKMMMVVSLSISLTACGTTMATTGESDKITVVSTELIANESISPTTVATDTDVVDTGENSMAVSYEASLLETSEMFTSRDLEQEADLAGGQYRTLASNEDLVITEEGIYVLSGNVENTSVIVAVDDEAKVQLVLDGLTINNESAPAIYVKSGDKIFITTTDSINSMEVRGVFEVDGDTNLDAVIFSKSDLVLNGIGSLAISSTTGNGITSKDDLKITGGTYTMAVAEDAIEANDSIRIHDGKLTIDTDKDALHSENDEDTSLGYIYIEGGTLNISAADDAIRGTSLVQIDGGTINIATCAEGIEGTSIQINGGDIDIYATDDGINAAAKSDYDVYIEVNGGNINIVMASGDTDGFDANGDIIINGGTISVEANSSFDADKSAVLNGGTVMVNGVIVTELPASQMGGGRSQRK